MGMANRIDRFGNRIVHNGTPMSVIDYVLELREFQCEACSHEVTPADRYCDACGAEQPDLNLVVLRTKLPPYTYPEKVERALTHALRDVYDGHVGLWGARDAFRRTGEVLVDREVSAALKGIPWVEEMLRRGWIVPERGGRDRLVATGEARRVLLERGLL